MQIVIDITKDTFEKIREFDGEHDVLIDRGKLYEAIQNGTPLLKEHGRLIDADELYDSLIFPNSLFGKAFKEILDDAPTIIEAESED